jgi:hypothetical protein
VHTWFIYRCLYFLLLLFSFSFSFFFSGNFSRENTTGVTLFVPYYYDDDDDDDDDERLQK